MIFCHIQRPIWIALTLTLGVLAPSLAPAGQVVPEAVDAALEELVETGQVAGASMLIHEDGEEVYFGAFGEADREAGTPMRRDTIVQIFSMTKPVTGVALMQQWERGAFELDDPVAKYLPEFADVRVYEGEDENGDPVLVAPRRPPTIRDFTRHTAGLPNGGMATGYLRERYQQAAPMNLDNTLAETTAALATIPLAYHPGEQWLYRDVVEVQARLVEVFSGQAFADYLAEHIFTPLAMHETAYFVPENQRHRLAVTYEARDGEGALVPSTTLGNSATFRHALTPGGWGLASTLDDYMRFARMLLNGGELNGARILEADTIRLMATSHLADDVEERSWLPGKGQVGFGIDFAVRVRPPVSDEENAGTVGEFFWDGAATTLFWVDPRKRIASVFFIQRFPFYGEAHKRVRDAVYRPDLVLHAAGD